MWPRSTPDGTALIYCGYIGGSGYDEGNGIAVDGDGNAYVTGYTASTEATFPVKVGPDLTYNGYDDAFVAKINADGTALVYCGYIGGSDLDYGEDIAVDGAGNVYVTGTTGSTEATFPVTTGPDLTSNGISEAFVAKIALVAPDDDSNFWGLMIPVITAGRRCAAIPNGNFESGNTAWSEYSELGYEIITNDFPAGVLPHNGSYAAWLGGADNEISLIVQRLLIPSSCPFLTFYHWINSSDDCGYDYGLVFINDTLVGTYQLCAARNTGGWRVQSIDLSAYAGQTVDLIISAATDESILSSWYIDDVSFQASAQ